MEEADIEDAIKGIRREVVNSLIDEHVPPDSVEELWDKEGLKKAIEGDFGVHIDIARLLEERADLNERLC